MKALCWHGHGDVRIDTVPDPKLEKPTDVIVKITTSGICGSDGAETDAEEALDRVRGSASLKRA